MLDTEEQLKKVALQEMAGQDSDTKSVASTRASSDSASGHHSDSELQVLPDSEELEAATSLATIMMVASELSRRPIKQQPASAPAAMQTSTPANRRDDFHSEEEDGDDGTIDPSKAKKLRRREKNRASAQQSRQRKKHHLEQLEQRVDELERDKAALYARLEKLQHDNNALRMRLPPAGDNTSSTGATLSPPLPGAACEGKATEVPQDVTGAGLLAQLAHTAQLLAA